MFSVFKKRREPRLRTPIGTFRFNDTGWIADSVIGSLVILFTRDEFDVNAVDRVKPVLADISAFSAKGIVYAKANGVNVWSGKGTLLLEAVDITDIASNSEFGLTYGVEDEPDFTVTVEFREGEPYLIWAAD